MRVPNGPVPTSAKTTKDGSVVTRGGVRPIAPRALGVCVLGRVLSAVAPRTAGAITTAKTAAAGAVGTGYRTIRGLTGTTARRWAGVAWGGLATTAVAAPATTAVPPISGRGGRLGYAMATATRRTAGAVAPAAIRIRGGGVAAAQGDSRAGAVRRRRPSITGGPDVVRRVSRRATGPTLAAVTLEVSRHQVIAVTTRTTRKGKRRFGRTAP